MVRASNREKPGHKGLCLPAIYRTAAERCAEGGPGISGMPDHAYGLWCAFVGNGGPLISREICVLGLLLLAEILETAE